MQNIRPRNLIRAKISTMPRPKTEASEQLELYKMVTKRQRIQKELQLTEQHLKELRQELNVLNNQIENTEKTIQNFRQSTSSSSQTPIDPNSSSTQSPTAPKISKTGAKSSNFETFYLDY